MSGDKSVSIHIPLFTELFGALPLEYQTETIREALLMAYRYELHCLINAALNPDCLRPRIAMHSWRQAGIQWIIEFWVADAEILWANQTNFHGQNTSQWRYGGAIVLQNGEVSTHH